MEFSDEQERIKARLFAERGFWSSFHETLLTLDPGLLDAYTTLSGVPWRKGHLSPKVKELLYLAMDASTTHLHLVGARTHMRNAIAHGATREEVIEILELVSAIGLQTMTVGVPIVLQVAQAFGTRPPLPDSTGRGGEVSDLVEERAGRTARSLDATSIQEEFVRLHDYWDETIDAVLHATPEYLEAYITYSAAARSPSVVPPVDSHLILLGVNAAVTHLHEPAIRWHARSALAAGATVAQLIEVLEVVSVVGIHTITGVFPIVLEEFGSARDGDAASP